MKKKTVAVIVTYNRKEMLMQCLEHLKKQSYQEFDILVVDNASTDGTSDLLQPLVSDQQIIYVNTGANLGGAGGFSFGMHLAVKYGYEYIWLMDDDTLPFEDALEKFFAADKSLCGNYGFLSGKALWTDGTLCRMNIQKKNVFSHLKSMDDKLVEIGVATFVSLFTKAEVVRDVGLPISEFFIWTDDVEYTDRISKKYKCYLVCDSCVTHAMKTNIGVNLASEQSERLDRYRYCYRNEVYVYRRHGIKGFFYLLAKDLYHCFCVLVYSHGRRAVKLRILFSGVKEGLSFRPQIQYCD